MYGGVVRFCKLQVMWNEKTLTVDMETTILDCWARSSLGNTEIINLSFGRWDIF